MKTNHISQRQQAINSFEEELAKNNSKKRKEDTRRKILLGAYLMEMMKNDNHLKSQVMNGLDQYLEKKIDRELFDL